MAWGICRNSGGSSHTLLQSGIVAEQVDIEGTSIDTKSAKEKEISYSLYAMCEFAGNTFTVLIQGSNDNSHWDTIIGRVSNIGGGYKNVAQYGKAKTSYRYIRAFTGNKRNGGSNGFAEFSVVI